MKSSSFPQADPVLIAFVRALARADAEDAVAQRVLGMREQRHAALPNRSAQA